MVQNVSAGLSEIRDSRTRLNSKFDQVLASLTAIEGGVTQLSNNHVSYAPFADRSKTINAKLTQLRSLGETDPIGALNSFGEVENLLKSFQTEVGSVSSLVTGLAQSREGIQTQRKGLRAFALRRSFARGSRLLRSRRCGN